MPCGISEGLKKHYLSNRGKLKPQVDDRKYAKKEERDIQLKLMLSEMEDIHKMMKKKENSTIIIKALKLNTDEEIK